MMINLLFIYFSFLLLLLFSLYLYLVGAHELKLTNNIRETKHHKIYNVIESMTKTNIKCLKKKIFFFNFGIQPSVYIYTETQTIREIDLKISFMPKGVYDLLFISYLILYESHVIYFCRQRLFS